MSYSLSAYIFFVTGTLIFSFLSNKLFLRFSANLGTRGDKKLIRWSREQKPSLGGITFFIVFLFSFAIYPVVFGSLDIADKKLAGLLGASTLAFIMGLSDDAYNTKPFLKFFTQIACAVILIYTGTYIRVFELDILNYSLTLLWVVGIMNSLNMLDNMDGIATIASVSILMTILLGKLIIGPQYDIYTILLSGMLSALLSFLYFNWNPSKMFMGDTGSQFLGVLLAAFAIMFLWNPLDGQEHRVTSKQFLLPLLAFLLPIADTTTVFINRIARGQSPFVGGKDHTTHHLSYLGLSDQQVGIIAALICFISMCLALSIIFFVEEWNHWLTILFSLYAFIVIVSLFYVTKITSEK